MGGVNPRSGGPVADGVVEAVGGDVGGVDVSDDVNEVGVVAAAVLGVEERDGEGSMS